MTPSIRPSISALAASPIRQVSSACADRDDIIPLWFGEPDQPTPAFICDAAAAALRAGHTFYTANLGISPLREALAAYQSRLHRREIDPARVMVTASAMNALMLLSEILIDPGDAATIIGPVWPNIPGTVAIMGGEPRICDLRQGNEGWRLDFGALEATIDERTRMIIVNTPNNPTGWTASHDELSALLDLCRRRGLWLIVDEVYNRLAFDAPHAPSILEIAEPDDAVVAVNSFSKTWAMTGWRLGWMTAPARLADDVAKVVEFNVSHPATFSQYGGLAAIRDGEPFIERSVARYRAGRDVVVARLEQLEGIRFVPPTAGLYVFFAVDGVSDSTAFATELALRHGVGLAPGVAFGERGEGHLRLCFAADTALLERAIDRLAAALGNRAGLRAKL